jgi:catechol 2,3-dioxygenase
MIIDPNLRIRAVHLAVADLARSAEFYERSLGLPVLFRDEDRVELQPTHPDGDAALVLTQIASPTPLPPGATGLYHVAWLHPTRADLAATVRRVAETGWRFEGASDHGVSEALYLSDPDGLGIEIYADRPRDRWELAPDGEVRMYTLPLDLEDLLAQAPTDPPERIAPRTFVGHVHLKVADVPRTAAFYTDALGFEERARLPSAAFVAAGGYHHHVGLNSWQSQGAGPAPDTAPGLRRVEFELAALDDLERALGDIACDDGSLTVRDPDGELLSFVAQG